MNFRKSPVKTLEKSLTKKKKRHNEHEIEEIKKKDDKRT